MNLFVRADDAERDWPLPWLFVAATIFGAGVWVTHFITELAFEPGFPSNYDAGLTAFSFLAAIGAVWLGMFVVHRFAAPVLGGAMMGAGLAAMHYIGLAALRAPAQQYWDAGYVQASVAIAMTAAAAGMRALLWGPALWGRLMAAVLRFWWRWRSVSARACATTTWSRDSAATNSRSCKWGSPDRLRRASWPNAS